MLRLRRWVELGFVCSKVLAILNITFQTVVHLKLILISLPKAHWFECLGSARKVQSCVGSGTTMAKSQPNWSET